MSNSCENNPELLSQLEDSLPGTDFAHLKEFRESILSPNEDIRALQKAAFCTPRDLGGSAGTIDCLNIDSLHAQLLALCQTEGNLDETKRANLIARAEKYGVIFYADGIKVQLVTTIAGKGKACGDRYVATNLEILICAAKKMNCDLVTSIYSGDENVGLILIPREDSEYENAENVETIFAQTCNRLMYATYRNKEHPQAALFQEMQTAITAGTVPGKETSLLGFTLETRPISGTRAHLPPQHNRLRLNALAAAGLDLACDKDPISNISQALLLEQIFSAFTIDVESASDEALPLHTSAYLFNLYTKAVSAGLSPNYALELLNRAIFESTFPRSLRVRKKTQMGNDIEEGIASNNTYHLVYLANTQVKHGNSISHTHGDNEIVAGVDVVQRYLRDRLGDDCVHDGIRYYKSEGSNLLLIEDRVWDQVRPLLADPLAINTHIYDQEVIRRSKPLKEGESLDYRANPFIVTTISDLAINSATPVERIWREIDYELRPKQLARERAYTILATFSAQTQLDLLITNLSHIIGNLNSDQLATLATHSHEYQKFGKNYLLGRLSNHDFNTLMTLLQDNKLVENLLDLLR